MLHTSKNGSLHLCVGSRDCFILGGIGLNFKDAQSTSKHVLGQKYSVSNSSILDFLQKGGVKSNDPQSSSKSSSLGTSLIGDDVFV